MIMLKSLRIGYKQQKPLHLIQLNNRDYFNSHHLCIKTDQFMQLAELQQHIEIKFMNTLHLFKTRPCLQFLKQHQLELLDHLTFSNIM